VPYIQTDSRYCGDLKKKKSSRKVSAFFRFVHSTWVNGEDNGCYSELQNYSLHDLNSSNFKSDGVMEY